MRFPIKLFFKELFKELSFSSVDLSKIKPLISFLYFKKSVSCETYQKSVDFLISKTGGSQFQQSVWREILKIKLGAVVKYSEIAIKLQNPKCYRAVANACSKNPFPLLIPCHRVVGVSGIGGYTLRVNSIFSAFNVSKGSEASVNIKRQLLLYEANKSKTNEANI